MNTTIFALSSGQGRAGVAVIRVSGPNADAILLGFAGYLPKARQATLMTIKEPTSKERLDQCLVLRFLENASFTGEPCFEFHVRGLQKRVSLQGEHLKTGSLISRKLSHLRI
jgi:tRNA modification GTPase